MALTDLIDWLDLQSRPGILWYLKRLAANDTLASGSHQAGPYIPKEILFRVLPALHHPDQENPDLRFELRIDSHRDSREIRAIWYNNKLRGGTRNEARLTNFGGGRSALLDPNSTGALAVFCFHPAEETQGPYCHAWICSGITEEELIEERIGPVEPGRYRTWILEDGTSPSLPSPALPPTSCWLQPGEIPPHWLERFPSGAEIVRKTMERRPEPGQSPDVRLMRRRECEFELFRSLEQAIELPSVLKGFETVDEFIQKAQTILQRRKARAGRSLELHLREIFLEEGLVEGRDFQHQPESDPGQRPDFLFPSQKAYQDSAFPDNQLGMLAVKTTCKDRWRQILTEASRIGTKHLLTLQEGVSGGQFEEMQGARVQLVVPFTLIPSYPASVQPHLQTLRSFIDELR